jgi:hypothetical protein
LSGASDAFAFAGFAAGLSVALAAFAVALTGGARVAAGAAATLADAGAVTAVGGTHATGAFVPRSERLPQPTARAPSTTTENQRAATSLITGKPPRQML